MSHRLLASTGRAARRGFTMMELLVVLAVLALLVGLAITNFGNVFGGAQVSTAELFVKQTLNAPLMTYRMQLGDYPSTQEGLQALIAAPSGKEAKWGGPYITESQVPRDPWNEPYQYQYPGTHNKNGYDLWSKGPPGKDRIIGNWDTSAPTENK
jgi:general secretion pathway protein G